MRINNPCVLRHFQIFDKIDKFPKKVFNVFRMKKESCIIEELSNLYLIVLVISFSPLILWITAESRTKLKELYIWTTKSAGSQHRKHTNCTWWFISNCNNASDILDWTWFLHYLWLHEFIQQQNYEQAKNFFNPANTQSSSEESLKEKCHKFIGICSLFTLFNKQILNLCHRWHRRIHNPLKYLKCSVLRK